MQASGPRYNFQPGLTGNLGSLQSRNEVEKLV
jgi:hypothetical protein